MHKSSSTITWWMDQNKEVRTEAFNKKHRVGAKEALMDVLKWFKGSGSSRTSAKYIYGITEVFLM